MKYFYNFDWLYGNMKLYCQNIIILPFEERGQYGYVEGNIIVLMTALREIVVFIRSREG